MQTKKPAIAIILFSAIVTFAGISFAGAQGYTPLVQIPGVPAGSTNLSLYLVGLYNFLLSVVGIVAVMMLIIGGMRYITAAGNQAAISDAKDIITSALFGLLLAILSWVIVAEINPDVLYIKKPGADFATTTSTALGSCGTYDPLAPPAASCTCVDPAAPVIGTAQGVIDQNTCSFACRALNYCLLPNSKCIEVGTLADGNGIDDCNCVDGTDILSVVGQTCHDTCLAANNCLVADAKIGNYSLDIITYPLLVPSDYEEFEGKYCNNDSPEENPITFADGSSVLLCGRFDSISGNPILRWEWDMNPIDGVYDFFVTEGGFQAGLMTSFGANSFSYAVLSANLPLCKLSADPQAVTCPIKFQITDTVGNTSEDVVYLRVLAP